MGFFWLLLGWIGVFFRFFFFFFFGGGGGGGSIITIGKMC